MRWKVRQRDRVREERRREPCSTCSKTCSDYLYSTSQKTIQGDLHICP